MKRKSIISLFIGLLGFSVATTSCEDMLTPDMDRYAEGFSGKDTVAFYMGILSNLQDVAEQNFLLGEIRGDLERKSVEKGKKKKNRRGERGWG